MTRHPVEATTIGQLGLDYLIDRTVLDRAERRDRHPSPSTADENAWAHRLSEMLRAAAQLAEADSWREVIGAAAELGPDWRTQLRAMVGERTSAQLFDPAWPVTVQVDPDVQAVLDVLAVDRQFRRPAQGDTGVPLAERLQPRPTIPPRRPADGAASGPGLEVVEIGDLADPFSCRAHARVYAELGTLRAEVRWRWLYCATLRSLPASHRAAAVTEQVLDLAPQAFWPVVDTLAEHGLGAGVEHAQAVLTGLGLDPTAGRPPAAGSPLPEGLLRDRTMATVCGLPSLRPLFVIGRTVFAGTDAAPRLAARLSGDDPGTRR